LEVTPISNRSVGHNLFHIPSSVIRCTKVIHFRSTPVGKQSIVIGVMWPEKAHMEVQVDLPALEFLWELQLIVGGFREGS
jgi:hypothetical protein